MEPEATLPANETLVTGGGAAPRRSRRALAVAAIAGLAVLGVLVVGLVVAKPWVQQPSCRPADHPEWSVARRWDEALLDAIRRALPAPPNHARNLFHVSAAMWDAWAAYDPHASGYFVKEKPSASDVTAARNEAISYAAYRAIHQGRRRRPVAVGVRRPHGRAVLPARRDDDPGRLPRRAREPDRQGGNRI